jgi:cbb3-type cytochrome oxidase cytochrome c subunit
VHGGLKQFIVIIILIIIIIIIHFFILSCFKGKRGLCPYPVARRRGRRCPHPDSLSACHKRVTRQAGAAPLH